MSQFFENPAPLNIRAVLDLVGGELIRGNEDQVIRDAGPLSDCSSDDISFLDNPKYIGALEESRAAFVITSKKFVERIPDQTGVIVAADPYRAFATVLRALYPAAIRPESLFGLQNEVHPGAVIHPTAVLEDNVTVDPGVVIGPDAEIGSGTVLCAGAKIGASVKIGRNCAIGSDATVTHSLLGDQVIIHPGVRLGQDGFGFAMGPAGHLKVPQIGRVIIQDDVEIGANSTVDRGAVADTVIGAGTKIDNLVQIAHNVQIGRCCILVSQVGISGSSVLEDFVVIAGKSGVSGHLRIGMGAQIGGASNVKDNVPAGAVWVGTPAQPVKDWMRQFRALKKHGR